jgi:hypothetical protein
VSGSDKGQGRLDASLKDACDSQLSMGAIELSQPGNEWVDAETGNEHGIVLAKLLLRAAHVGEDDVSTFLQVATVVDAGGAVGGRRVCENFDVL